MRFNELLNEGKQISEAVPKSKGANAFGQMAKSLAGEKPNTMANAPVSATNKAKPGNPNSPSFGKGTAMPTKPFQVPGAGTNPTPKTAAPKAEPAQAAAPAEPEAPSTAQSPAAGPEKNGLMYKMGKGIGDFGRGFKIGYGGRMPTDADVVPDEEPGGATDATGDKSAEPDAATAKEPSDYARIKTNVDKLDKKGKQRILAMLQKELGIATKSQPAAGKTAPAAKDTGAGAFGQMASQLTAPKPAQSSTGGQTIKTATGKQHVANPNNPNAAPKAAPAGTTSTIAPEPVAPAKKPARTGGKVAGQVSQTPNAVRKRNARAAAKPVQNAGLERSGNMISESFSFFRKK